MGVNYLKKGKEARKAAKHVDAENVRRREESENRIKRFWLKRGTERRITFLDGDLDDDGELELTTYYEHNLYMNGRWNNFFVCTGNEEEPCPICEEGNLPAYCAAFTIIDHTKYTDRNGKSHKDDVCLLIAKRQTQQLLEMQAAKRGGLAGVTFDVARTNEEQAAAVGTMFDYVGKNPIKAICNKFKIDGPFDYEEVLGYQSPTELRKQGFGKTEKTGDEAPVEDPNEEETTMDDGIFDGDVDEDDV